MGEISNISSCFFSSVTVLHINTTGSARYWPWNGYNTHSFPEWRRSDPDPKPRRRRRRTWRWRWCLTRLELLLKHQPSVRDLIHIYRGVCPAVLIFTTPKIIISFIIDFFAASSVWFFSLFCTGWYSVTVPPELTAIQISEICHCDTILDTCCGFVGIRSLLRRPARTLYA